MAHRVTGDLSSSADMLVLAAVGGAGNAVFIVGPSDERNDGKIDAINQACIEIGWRPLVVTIDEKAEDQGFRPHDMSVSAAPVALPGLLADRFHSGMPIHYLSVEGSSVASGFTEPLAPLGIRPWILRQAASLPASAGYQQVGTQGDYSWWIAA